MPFVAQPIALTAATTLTKKAHGNGLVVWNSTTGATVTLPASSGDGTIFTVLMNKLIGSGTFKLQAANATDVMAGVALTVDDDGVPANAWATSATSDSIWMDGSTTGGKVGDKIVLIDMASGFWQVNVFSNESGTEATPFTAAVS
jgi:hypothetical protein